MSSMESNICLSRFVQGRRDPIYPVLSVGPDLSRPSSPVPTGRDKSGPYPYDGGASDAADPHDVLAVEESV